MVNFLVTLESTGETDGMLISQFVAAIGSEFNCVHVCDDVSFAMNEELGLTEHHHRTYKRRSRRAPFRLSDANRKTRKELRENAVKAEFKGCVNPSVFNS